MMISFQKLTKALVICVAVLAIQGCASSGPLFTEMPQAQQGPKPDMARVYIYRTTIVGAAIQPDVMMNGQGIGSAVPKGFFYVDQPAGNYKISTSTEVERSLSLSLEPGQTTFVRLGVSMGFFVGHIYPELVENAEGRKDIAACHFTGKAL